MSGATIIYRTYEIEPEADDEFSVWQHDRIVMDGFASPDAAKAFIDDREARPEWIVTLTIPHEGRREVNVQAADEREAMNTARRRELGSTVNSVRPAGDAL